MIKFKLLIIVLINVIVPAYIANTVPTYKKNTKKNIKD